MALTLRRILVYADIEINVFKLFQRGCSFPHEQQITPKAKRYTLMSKILIEYFSQGWTTTQIAESISQGLWASGNKIKLCNIIDDKPPSLESYDILGIGTPAYYSRPPFLITAMLRALNASKACPPFFVSHGTYQGETRNDTRHARFRKGT